LITGLPGLHVIPLESDPPPQVLVWETGSGDLTRSPHHAPETALLLIVNHTSHDDYILSLREVSRRDTDLVGVKAANLGELVDDNQNLARPQASESQQGRDRHGFPEADLAQPRPALIQRAEQNAPNHPQPICGRE